MRPWHVVAVDKPVPALALCPTLRATSGPCSLACDAQVLLLAADQDASPVLAAAVAAPAHVVLLRDQPPSLRAAYEWLAAAAYVRVVHVAHWASDVALALCAGVDVVVRASPGVPVRQPPVRQDLRPSCRITRCQDSWSWPWSPAPRRWSLSVCCDEHTRWVRVGGVSRDYAADVPAAGAVAAATLALEGGALAPQWGWLGADALLDASFAQRLRVEGFVVCVGKEPSDCPCRYAI